MKKTCFFKKTFLKTCFVIIFPEGGHKLCVCKWTSVKSIVLTNIDGFVLDCI